MDTKFHYDKAKPNDPVVFEQIFSEKPGGGIVLNQNYDVPPGTAVGYNAKGKLSVIKGYKLHAAVTSGDTSIQVKKGSGVANGDIIAVGKKGVACTNVDTSNSDYDEVTVTLGVSVDAGTVLYQAKSANATNTEPVLQPSFVIGDGLEANNGDQSVRLVNGANLRKETAIIAKEVVALMPGITLV